MKSEVIITILPEYGDAYHVILVINPEFDAEEQIDAWIEDNLINVQYWEWA